MKTKLHNVLAGQHGNHIFPFFWQHGEDDTTLLSELHKIYESGIRSVCVEARPAPDFGKEPWFEDMELILAECEKLGMEFWLLDDDHFPTGKANGLLWNKYPHLGRRQITERHMDVAGPAADCAAMVKCWLGEEDRLVGIVACKRYPDRLDQRMTGEAIDLTDRYDPESGMVFFDLPEGYWRIFTLIDTPMKNQYIDMMREESVHVLIEAVYEPHYNRLKKYFGKTFRGYFSDEPFLAHNIRMLTGGENRSKGCYPWNDLAEADLAALHGESWRTDLPALWFPSDAAPKMRVDYMEVVTKRYEKCFCWQLGNWCREHGVEYIGHIIEDDNLHTAFSGGGHFFRSLNGQDMAGIDVVLCQIVPGMTHNTIAVPCSYDKSDADFFHFGLAKLGSSHAHIQPLKKGRAMCEIYGAYGWAEGTKMMKWLTDHMLVRGINEYVPHAFSPKYPDPDCPPHFYAGGHNPEYLPFGKLMGYMNRVADLLSGGLHHASAALYYHAQAEWSGENFMRFQIPAKVLTENQIDFDVIPEDYLDSAFVKDGKLHLNGESYGLFVLPYARLLPAAVVEKFAAFARAGLPVWCAGGLPEGTVEGTPIGEETLALLRSVTPDALAAEIRAAQLDDMVFTGACGADLRVYHYSRNGGHVLFLTNEGITGTVEGTLRLRDFAGGALVRYDPMENRAWQQVCGEEIPLRLEPYGSVMLFFGDVGDVSALPVYAPEAEAVSIPVSGTWKISFAAPEAYDPAAPDFSVFGDTEETDELYNIVRRHRKFAGFVKYETTLTLPEAGVYTLDLGQVGEACWVFADGKAVGDAIVPPYRFTAAGEGTVQLTVVTVSHLGYAMQDRFSAFLTFEPVGLLGPVEIRKNG